MKYPKIVLIIILFSALSASAQDTTNSQQQLDKVQLFIHHHFSNMTVEKMKIDDKDRKYKIELKQGYELKFDSSANWIELETDYRPFPKSIIDLLPAETVKYIARYYPRHPITKIKRKDYGYKIELSNAPDLKFNREGIFIKKD